MERTAIRLRIRPPKRRTPSQKLEARLYYRKNRVKILQQRRRYIRTHKSVLKHRKLFQRYKPTWYHKSKPKVHKPRKFRIKVPKFLPIHKPKVFRVKRHPSVTHKKHF